MVMIMAMIMTMVSRSINRDDIDNDGMQQNRRTWVDPSERKEAPRIGKLEGCRAHVLGYGAGCYLI